MRDRRAVPALYVASILACEVLLRVGLPGLALAAYGTLLLVSLNAAAGAGQEHGPLHLSIALVAIARALNLALPLGAVDPAYWTLAVAMPVLLGIGLGARAAQYRPSDVGLQANWIALVLGALAVPAGLAAGLVDYIILEPYPLLQRPDLAAALLPGLALLFSTGFVEELLFRGMLLRSAMRLLGRWRGVAYTTLVFAIVAADPWLGSHVLLVLATGALLAIMTISSGSIGPAAVYHGAFSMGLFLLPPFISKG